LAVWTAWPSKTGWRTSVRTKRKRATLKINRARVSDSGNYSCRFEESYALSTRRSMFSFGRHTKIVFSIPVPLTRLASIVSTSVLKSDTQVSNMTNITTMMQ
jgi:hypothetical protein